MARATRSAYTWKQFFAMLCGKEAKRIHDNETENYVATFSAAFKLAKAPYNIGGKVVML